MSDSVLMTHPDSGPVVETTAAAFDEVWSEKGWQKVSPSAAAAAALTDGATTDLSTLHKADLEQLCDARGIEVPAGATKADLVALLEASAA